MERPEPGEHFNKARELLAGLGSIRPGGTDTQVDATAAVANALLAVATEVNGVKQELARIAASS